MHVRQTKLFIIAAALCALAVAPVGCASPYAGGGDNTDGDSNNNGGDPAGGDSPGDSHFFNGDNGGDSDDITTICTDIKNKIVSCQASMTCSVDVSTFVDDCVAIGAFTSTDRDNFVGANCTVFNEFFCPTTGTCEASQTCYVVLPNEAVCTDSSGNAPAGATTCQTTDNCTAGTQICLGPENADGACFNYCAPPACANSTHCTIVDNAGDAACMQSSGAFPDGAVTCNPADSTPCTAAQGCLTMSSVSKCVDLCFTNDGTATTSSVHQSAQILLKH